MSSHKITHWIEVPVDIYFEFQPEERPTQTYPGCMPNVSVEDVKIAKSKCGNYRPKSIEDYLLSAKYNELEAACWDHLMGLEDK